MKKLALILTAFGSVLMSCSSEESGGGETYENLGISPVTNADLNSSYSNSKPDIYIPYYLIPSNTNAGQLRDAIAYIDANNDGVTDVFMATGDYLLDGEVDCILALNDGTENFSVSTTEFNNNMPVATHARKTIVSDFNNDGLEDMFVFDHGYDSYPYSGSQPKLIMQNSAGNFSWSKFSEVGFFHGGAAADVDNDGDTDIFVGGFDPFFYINDGSGNFTKATNRYDHSVDKVFTAELIDIDLDGYVDLLVGAHEQDGDNTTIYWGNSTGSYTSNARTVIPTVTNYGTVLDFDAEDLDGDGDKDLVVNRTGSGSSNFYQGRYIQLLTQTSNKTFTDATSQIDNNGSSSENWFPWVRIQDADTDGDLDIFSDNQEVGFMLHNDGNGNFVRM